MKKRFSLGYAIFCPLTWLGGKVFYRRFSVSGKRRIPKRNVPTILVANHQNGMMDPLMACISMPRQLSWLTRADIFKNPIANKVLRHINMLPVYRPHDRVADLAKMNAQTFETASDRLMAGNVISAFPEGNHAQKKRLRRMKKGVARIVGHAAERSNYEKEIEIVACGLDYSDYTKFRSDIIVRFSHPIKASKFYPLFKEDPNKASTQLMDEVRHALRNCMVDIPKDEWYDLILGVFPFLRHEALKQMQLPKTPNNHLICDQHISKTLQNLSPDKDDLLKNFDTTFKKLKNKAKEINVEPRYLFRAPAYRIGLTFVLGVLLSPVLCVGVFMNYPMTVIIRKLVGKIVKDPHFTSSITMALGMFLFPIYWIILALIFGTFAGDFSLGLGVVTLGVVSGIVTLYFRDIFLGVVQILRVRRFKRRSPDEYEKFHQMAKDFHSGLLEII